MKAGLGIPGPIMGRDTMRFARQIGATHIVAHFASDKGAKLDTDGFSGLERSIEHDERFTYDHLVEVRESACAEGLELAAVENFTAADWSDVLLDGPRRESQMAHLKQIVRDMGRAGIPILGYNFSLAGVWGRSLRPVARGGALAAVFDRPEELGIPQGMVWNQVYDARLYQESDGARFLAPVTSDELWDRFGRFLAEMVPVAQEAGVTLALHPDDPPVATLRNTPRLVYRGELYGRVLDLQPSPRNALEFCVGSLAEMPDQDIYDVVARYAATGRISYVHLRNVTGRVPSYGETFVDDGDVDLQRVLRILAEAGFDGLVVPDHAPYPTCAAPWHAGMAYAMGWIRSALEAIDELEE